MPMVRAVGRGESSTIPFMTASQLDDAHYDAAEYQGSSLAHDGAGPPSQTPQSAYREDGGEGRGDAERDECPDPEKDSAGVDDPAADNSRPHHVADKDAQPKDPSDEHEDVPRSPFGQHQRSVQPDDEDDHPTESGDASRLQPARDLVHPVKCKQEDREQRRDGYHAGHEVSGYCRPMKPAM